MADVVVLDLGNVVLTWDPLPAVAAGVGEAEARRFLEGFDFYSWNAHQDAGRSWDDALAWLDEHHPEWSRHAHTYVEHFLLSMTGEVPGVRALLERLVAAEVPTYALSNWSAETYPIAAERYDVLSCFREVFVSGSLGMAKPDPAVFAYVTDRIGVSPQAVFFADDSATNVDGARAASWDAELFTDAAALEHQLLARGLLSG